MIELYKKQAPKTCDNFKNLCTSKVEGRTYKNTLVHRIVPNGWIQMGDIISGSKGDNGHSSFENKHVSILNHRSPKVEGSALASENP